MTNWRLTLVYSLILGIIFCVVAAFYYYGLGYKTALKYKTVASDTYILDITNHSPKQRVEVLEDAFEAAGIQIIPYGVSSGPVDSFHVSDDTSQLVILLNHDWDRIDIKILAARFGLNENQFEQKRINLRQVIDSLEQTDSYVLAKIFSDSELIYSSMQEN